MEYRRKTNLFKRDLPQPYKISRSKIDLFIDCPRCFYLDRIFGIGRPGEKRLSLYSAVDTLLKKEFDIHRRKHQPHPLMSAYGIKAIPLAHRDFHRWREMKYGGISYLHTQTNLQIFGIVDDVWINQQGEYLIVDYKSTSREEDVTIDEEWQKSYKRQLEIYQWLFIKNNYKVSKLGYFVYCNGSTDRKALDGKLEFDITLIPYLGNTDWVEPMLFKIKECLMNENAPAPSVDCEFCAYRELTSYTG